MSKTAQLWKLFIEWLSKKIRSPFSNFATKATLILGGSIVASPIIEHLIFNAILKSWLGVDLKIEVPDTEAYLFGSLLICISLVHNLIFIKLTNSYQIKLNESKDLAYRGAWESLDNVIDDTARLLHLFTKEYDKSFDDLTLKAEESIISCTSYLRKNRPFFFSEELYTKSSEINNISYRVIQYYRACLKSQKYRDGFLKPEDINDVSVENNYKNYNYLESQKFTKQMFDEAFQYYEEVCCEIRECVNAI